MDNLETGRSPDRQKLPIGLYGPPESGNIIAEHFPEAAWLQKITLHIDDQKGGISRVELVNVRLGLYAHGAAQVHGSGDVSGIRSKRKPSVNESAMPLKASRMPPGARLLRMWSVPRLRGRGEQRRRLGTPVD
jgi:hypothetical protein